MMMPSAIPIIPLEEIKRVVSERTNELIEAQEAGFVELSAGNVFTAPVQHLDLKGGDVCVKTGFVNDGDFFVVKIAGGFPGNAALDLSTTSGMMLVFNSSTGATECLLQDGGYLTDVRTAIAGAIAAKRLAPRNVARIGVLGTGLQARFQIRFLRHVGISATIVVWGRTKEKVDAYIADMAAEGFDATAAATPAEVAEKCRLIVTTTASREPLLHDAKPGTHITAMGSDGLGKRELSPQLVAKADLRVADYRKQSLSFGEFSCIQEASQDAAIELGELLATQEHDRKDDDDKRITIFDSSGVAIQDVKIALAVMRACRSST